MNWVDIISLVAWVAGAAFGFATGFIRIMIPFVFVVSGVGLAGALAIAFGPVFLGSLDTESPQTAAVFLIVFALLQLVGGLIAYMVRHPMSILSAMVSVFPLGSLFNRGGGLAGGVFAACILVSTVLIGLQQLPVDWVGEGIRDSSFAHRPVGWVDRFVGAVEVSDQWSHGD